MKYENTVSARFLDRPNRFIAHVELDGKTETVHVKNTGRCKELLIPGAEVILSAADMPERKTKYDLIAVNKEGLGWVNIDSQAPNGVVKEWLQSSPSPFEDLTYFRPEFPYGSSRVDFYLECGKRKILMEVKGCTLERDKTGYFPDAPTSRGVKHIHELTGALSQGYESVLAFVVAMPEIEQVLPNTDTDPQFGKALEEARQAGVQVLSLPCDVMSDTLFIRKAVSLSRR